MNRVRFACRSLLKVAPLRIAPLTTRPLWSAVGMRHIRPHLQTRLISSSVAALAVHQPFTLKTVEDRIMLVLRLYDKIDAEKLTLDTDFFKDAGLDSLDFVEVIIAIEDEFHMEIPDGDSDRFRTPRDIFQYICDKMDVYD